MSISRIVYSKSKADRRSTDHKYRVENMEYGFFLHRDVRSRIVRTQNTIVTVAVMSHGLDRDGGWQPRPRPRTADLSHNHSAVPYGPSAGETSGWVSR